MLFIFAALCIISRVVAGGEFDITVYDAQYLWTIPSNSDSHEHMQLLAALGGIVNRERPRLFVHATQADIDWFNYLTSPGQWLEGAVISYETSIVSLVSKFQEDIRGVVLFDGAVPSSSNVASSIAGIDDLLPLLAGGSLYNEICVGGPMLPVTQSLVGKFDGSITGSRKNDAYKWFIERYMSPANRSRVDPSYQGYFMVNLYSIIPHCIKF
jgi:hypothetical protein